MLTAVTGGARLERVGVVGRAADHARHAAQHLPQARLGRAGTDAHGVGRERGRQVQTTASPRANPRRIANRAYVASRLTAAGTRTATSPRGLSSETPATLSTVHRLRPDTLWLRALRASVQTPCPRQSQAATPDPAPRGKLNRGEPTRGALRTLVCFQVPGLNWSDLSRHRSSVR
jgi:hypothetical protein